MQSNGKGGQTQNEIRQVRNPAKAYLSRYRALKYKCKALERAIQAALEDATNTSPRLTEVKVQTSKNGDRMADSVLNAVEASEYLEEMRQECTKTMAEIMDAIQSVKNEVQQTVLIEKYINGRTLADIQSDIFYEKRNTVIIHGKALWSVWQYMKERGIVPD